MDYFKEALRGLYVKGYGKDKEAKEQLLTLLFIKYLSTSPDVKRNSLNDYIWQKLVTFEGNDLIYETDRAFEYVSNNCNLDLQLKIRDPEVLSVTIHILNHILFIFALSLSFYHFSHIRKNFPYLVNIHISSPSRFISS